MATYILHCTFTIVAGPAKTGHVTTNYIPLLKSHFRTEYLQSVACIMHMFIKGEKCNSHSLLA